MAGSLLLLLDDITTVLDDVLVMTKIAAKKTAGVLGDDLALNAQQVSGVAANREIPVVWAVAKGSLVNKALLVPAALAISALAPWAITPLLMLGGAFLCYEGVEKILHKFLHSKEASAHEAALHKAFQDPATDLVAIEKEKISGAIRTDFILSAEIVVIALGTVAQQPLVNRVGVLTAIALFMTVGVYGLVAGIVKLDDLGLALTRHANALSRTVGRAVLIATPWLMRALSIAGTAAMFLVGGGIIAHGVPYLHHLQEDLAHRLAEPWATLASMAFTAVVGLVLGALVVGLVLGAKRLLGKGKGHSEA